jgi:hypothetical protein
MSCPSDLLDSLRWDPLAHDQPSARSKLCSLCRESVQLCDFYKHPNTKDGLQSQCKACMLKAQIARAPGAHRLQSEAPSVECSEFAVTQELVPDALYIMTNPRLPGEIKIGRSRDPEERAKQLCAGNNYRMTVLRIYPGKGFLERTIHKKLKRRRVEEGSSVEWFRISVEQAEALIVAAIIEDDISKS